MKINLQANNNIKLSQNFGIKRFYLNSKIKLKSLLADVFVKIKKEGGNKALYQGDKFQHEYVQTRDIPNCISTSEDAIGTKLKKVLYYPEDIAKMEKMSKAEVKQYKKNLKQNGKYYYSNNDTYTVPPQNKSCE